MSGLVKSARIGLYLLILGLNNKWYNIIGDFAPLLKDSTA